jgi:hypothetical protein
VGITTPSQPVLVALVAVAVVALVEVLVVLEQHYRVLLVVPQ